MEGQIQECEDGLIDLFSIDDHEGSHFAERHYVMLECIT